MSRLFRSIHFVAQCVVIGLAAAFVIGLFAPQWTRGLRERFGGDAAPTTSAAGDAAHATPAATGAATASDSGAEPRRRGPGFGPGNTQAETSSEREVREVRSASYALAVSRAAPAVVSIYADVIETKVEQTLGVPTDPQLRQMIGAIPIKVTRAQPAQSLGSGVIVGSDGYVLTNFHVIRGASNIKAVLQDGRVVIAKLIGSDEDTDLAVLHLDATSLNSLPIAARTAIVGDVVLAIGNPFGLGNTVTMGIISALGRQVNPANGEEFLQTDAAINQGNSGGALVNTAGELVGINSNNYSPSGVGSVGIGFAIPVATAKDVLDQIVAHGHVVRAWMGVQYKDAPPPNANDLSMIGTTGAQVTQVDPNGPATAAGLRVGDVINRFDGVWISNQFTLRNREAHLAPGKKVALAVTRDGRSINLEVTLAERPQAKPAVVAGTNQPAS